MNLHQNLILQRPAFEGQMKQWEATLQKWFVDCLGVSKEERDVHSNKASVANSILWAMRRNHNVLEDQSKFQFKSVVHFVASAASIVEPKLADVVAPHAAEVRVHMTESSRNAKGTEQTFVPCVAQLTRKDIVIQFPSKDDADTEWGDVESWNRVNGFKIPISAFTSVDIFEPTSGYGTITFLKPYTAKDDQLIKSVATDAPTNELKVVNVDTTKNEFRASSGSPANAKIVLGLPSRENPYPLMLRMTIGQIQRWKSLASVVSVNQKA